MKELKAAVMTIILALSLTACSQGSNGAGASPNQSASSGLQSGAITSQTASSSGTPLNSSGGEKKILVAYFSWSGNTQEMASYIAQQTGGDLLELQPETPYPTDYNQCGEVALNERDTNARPAISNLPSSISEYDAVLLGYPIWWHTAPMIIGTFLESYDLTGMEIYPFTQSASMDTQQFDNSMAFIRENAAGAEVYDGLFARPSNTQAIDNYLAQNHLAD